MTTVETRSASPGAASVSSGPIYVSRGRQHCGRSRYAHWHCGQSRCGHWCCGQNWCGCYYCDHVPKVVPISQPQEPSFWNWRYFRKLLPCGLEESSPSPLRTPLSNCRQLQTFLHQCQWEVEGRSLPILWRFCESSQKQQLI